MMWNEFEQLAGVHVSYGVYSKVIEPMYMQLPLNVSKTEFIGLFDKAALKKMSDEDYQLDRFCDYSDAREVVLRG